MKIDISLVFPLILILNSYWIKIIVERNVIYGGGGALMDEVPISKPLLG